MKRKEQYPPKLFLSFFRWYCHPKLMDRIEGDLYEAYERNLKEVGERKADLKFGIEVLLLFRPGIIGTKKMYHSTNNYDMIKNYFVTSVRSLAINKFYNGLNLLGLTLGLAVGLLILLWVKDELNYDTFNTKAAHIYRINVHLESSGNKFAVQVIQPTIATFGLKEVPGIQQAVRVSDCNDYSVFRYGETMLKNNVAVYTDPSLFKIFDYPLLKGNANHPFPVTESVILTQSAAKRYFGDADPIGKILLGDNKDNFVVSGIVADFPENSWLKCDLLFSTALMSKKYRENGWYSFDEESWGNYGWVTFLQLQPGVSLKAVEDQLTKINVSHQPNLRPVDIGYYTLQPLRDIHLYGPDGNPTNLQTIKIFSIVALLILLIASINYVNLFTARATLRFKEVGVRKIIGASRAQLFAQFIFQSALFFFIASVLAVTLINFAMPLYNEIAGKHMTFNLLDPMLWQVIGLTLLVTLAASSIYPALLLSSFHPLNALKAKLSLGIDNMFFRKVLVVGQFAFSVGLIVATFVISKQLNYMLEKELGYDKTHVLSLQMQKMEDHTEEIKAELIAQGNISDVTSGSSSIVNVPGATLDAEWDGKSPEQTLFFHTVGVDKDYIPFFKIGLTEGQNFSGATSDSAHFILNETAVKEAGLKEPIGKKFRLGRTTGTIIGVAKDFHFLSLKERIQPFVFYHRKVNQLLFVKTDGRDLTTAVTALEQKWKQYNEGFPFDFSFLDENYKKHYQSEQRVGELFTIFTGMAVVISCLGLLGLATFTAERKIKEIGIRKVLGASVTNIIYLLSKDFITLIAISISIAVPVSWFMMQQWLENFAYQVTLQWWLIAMAGLSVVFIAFFAISFQTIKVARENPVNSLKTD